MRKYWICQGCGKKQNSETKVVHLSGLKMLCLKCWKMAEFGPNAK